MHGKQPTAGIVLAAGMSLRFQSTKQIARFKGKFLLAWVLEHALSSRLDQLVLVLGHDADNILKALKPQISHPRLRIVVNPNFKEGLSQSLRVGLTEVATTHPAVMFLLGDQPMVGTPTLDLLLERFWQSSKDICAPIFQGRRGNPVLITNKFYAQLFALEGDIGARQLIKANPDHLLTVKVEDPSCLIDVDTRADLKRLSLSLIHI